MKAIAATALAAKFTQPQVMAAGLSVSIILILLSVTRTLHIANRLLPLPLIRGIQLGTGLQLINKGVAAILAGSQLHYENYGFLDNFLVMVLGFVFAMVCYNFRKVNPAAVVLFLYGIVVALVLVFGVGKVSFGGARLGPDFQGPRVPVGEDFRVGFLNAGLGQLPLTILNSVIATSKLADDLFPERSRPVASVTAVGLLVGSMNIISAWFGCIPYCSGSGGLAAQYRFGARTHVSVIILGIFKIILGLAFGSALLPIFNAFPTTILGVMLVFAGVELGSCAKDIGGTDNNANNRFVITLITGSIVAAWANDGIGFLAGSIAGVCIWVVDVVERRGSLWEEMSGYVKDAVMKGDQDLRREGGGGIGVGGVFGLKKDGGI
ncbi:hypothetical protein HDU76_005386 [Blyttiomyces sp. JEL0837]|nr:hypothetical protein HDU76_005386 [Blyttiomyces sp. JEL0837]